MSRLFTLKRGFVLFLSVLAVFCLLVLSALRNLDTSVEHLRQLQDKRTQATALATAYKNHVQALTRNAMAFVSSEQPEFEEAYQHHAAVLQGQEPDADGIARPLRDRFLHAGFTEPELSVLEQAYTHTQALAELEVQAIHTAKGLFDDGAGGLKVGLPEPLLAKVLLFSQQYTQQAAGLARLIDDFDHMQSSRYEALIEQADAASRHAARLALAALAALLACSALALFALYRSIKTRLDQGLTLAERLAYGDLTAQAEVTRHDEIGQLLQALNGIGTGMQRIVGEAHARTRMMAAASHELSDGNADLSRRTSEQAASLQQTAAAMEQLNATVRQNAANAQDAARIVGQVSAGAAQGRSEVDLAARTMQLLRQSSGKMAGIVSVIEGIAFRTNILALNAAIEAARAGPQGRGFAVVAAEVRNLAQRSATSAKEVEALIKESLEHMSQGGQRVEQAGRSMREIVTAVEQASRFMHEITVASREQSDGIQQVTTTVTQLDAITQQNAAMVHQAFAATRDQQRQAEELAQALERFKLPHHPAPCTTLQAAAALAPQPAAA